MGFDCSTPDGMDAALDYCLLQAVAQARGAAAPRITQPPDRCEIRPARL